MTATHATCTCSTSAPARASRRRGSSVSRGSAARASSCTAARWASIGRGDGSCRAARRAARRHEDEARVGRGTPGNEGRRLPLAEPRHRAMATTATPLMRRPLICGADASDQRPPAADTPASRAVRACDRGAFVAYRLIIAVHPGWARRRLHQSPRSAERVCVLVNPGGGVLQGAQAIDCLGPERFRQCELCTTPLGTPGRRQAAGRAAG